MARSPELAALAALLAGGGGFGSRLGRHGGESSLGDLLGATLAGAVLLGPEGARILSFGDDDGAHEARIGRDMSRCDFKGYAVRGDYGWQSLAQTEVRHLATTVRGSFGEGEEKDVHVWCLANVEPDEDDTTTDRWLLWSLCQHARHSSIIPLRGDEEKVVYLANIVLDAVTNRLPSDEFTNMLRDGRPVRGKTAHTVVKDDVAAEPPAAPAAE